MLLKNIYKDHMNDLLNIKNVLYVHVYQLLRHNPKGEEEGGGSRSVTL